MMRLKAFFIGAFLLGCAGITNAAIIDLTVTASWVAADFDVSSTATNPPSGTADEDDDLVFGIAPSAGSTTFTLRIDTASVVTYSAGFDNGGALLTHDWYGYSDVELVGGSHSLGDATWDNSGILTGLVGPDGSSAALWSDTDISAGSPDNISFRMFGETTTGLTADIFLGSRTNTTISDSVLLWEYYQGEEIRNSNPDLSTGSGTVATSSVVPEPATALLMLVGMAAVARRRRARTV